MQPNKIIFRNIVSFIELKENNQRRNFVKKNIQYILILFCVLSYYKNLKAQDPHYSQFYANQLYLNPAFAGASVCPRIIMNYRNQWPSIPGTYETYNASYDQHIDKLSGGIGFLVSADKAGEGALSTNSISGIYSYRMDVSRRVSIKAGVQASFFQKKLDWNKFTFGDMIHPKWGFVYNTAEIAPTTSKYVFDFSAGAVAYSENIYGGFAVSHLTQPDETFFGTGKLPRKYTVHLGSIFKFSTNGKLAGGKDPSISPNIVYQQQQNFQQINYGLYFNKYPLIGGLWFRQSFNNADALIFLVGFQQKIFKFAYSYDLTVSKLVNSSGGAHEFSLNLQFECKPKKKKARVLSCPSF